MVERVFQHPVSVENLASPVADLREKGAVFLVEPRDLRPNLKIAFVRSQGAIRIELLERLQCLLQRG